MVELKSVLVSPPEELEELADSLSYLLSELRSGKVRSMFVLWFDENGARSDWVKARGITSFELVGALSCALDALKRGIGKDDGSLN